MSTHAPLNFGLGETADAIRDTTARWAAERLARGRYVEVPGARHEVIMEADDMRAVFLNEFDAMADLVSPTADAAVDPSARTVDMTAETPVGA